MLKVLQLLPQRSITGYVCLACQRQLCLAGRQTRRQLSILGDTTPHDDRPELLAGKAPVAATSLIQTTPPRSAITKRSTERLSQKRGRRRRRSHLSLLFRDHVPREVTTTRPEDRVIDNEELPNEQSRGEIERMWLKAEPTLKKTILKEHQHFLKIDGQIANVSGESELTIHPKLMEEIVRFYKLWRATHHKPLDTVEPGGDKQVKKSGVQIQQKDDKSLHTIEPDRDGSAKESEAQLEQTDDDNPLNTIEPDRDAQAKESDSQLERKDDKPQYTAETGEQREQQVLRQMKHSDESGLGSNPETSLQETPKHATTASLVSIQSVQSVDRAAATQVNTADSEPTTHGETEGTPKDVTTTDISLTTDNKPRTHAARRRSLNADRLTLLMSSVERREQLTPPSQDEVSINEALTSSEVSQEEESQDIQDDEEVESGLPKYGLVKMRTTQNAASGQKFPLDALIKRFYLPGKPAEADAIRFPIIDPGPRFADLRRQKASSEVGKAAEKSNETKDGKSPAKTTSLTTPPPQAILMDVGELSIEPLKIEQPPLAQLSFGLDRVLFSTGLVQLQDPHSRVYNFDPYLENPMAVQDFDFTALKEWKPSSQDNHMSSLAKELGKKYTGSTSSMTSTLSHFHYLLSHFRDINLDMLSRGFNPESSTFTNINRAPSSIFLRWQNGTYAIDGDKELDTPNVLMMLGKSMEKLLTLPKEKFERYRKGSSGQISTEEREAPETYQYTTMGDMLMRSQLDAYDPRLPGSGTFDLKTRAVVSIRMNAQEYEPMLGYELLTLQGQYESYEREYFDMLRSTMLKYMLQARMGCMDGIFMAYHNIERIFGFQYLPMYEIDRAMHGQIDRCLGDQEFKASIRMLNDVLNAATAKYPEQSLRIMIETDGTVSSGMVELRCFAEPMSESQINSIQAVSSARMASYEEKMMGIVKGQVPQETDDDEAPVDVPPTTSTSDNSLPPPSVDGKPPLFAAVVLVESRVNGHQVRRPKNLLRTDKWTVNYMIQPCREEKAWNMYVAAKARRAKALRVDKSTNLEGNAYLQRLVGLAQNGRAFRKKIDKAEAGKERVVWTASSSA